MNKLIVIGNTKGGAGKTTLVTHLAAYNESLGRKTLLIDADPTGALSIWAKKRNSSNIELLHYPHNNDLRRQLELVKDQHGDKLILVDCGGFDSRSMRTSIVSDATDAVIISSKCSAIDLAVARPFIIETAKALSGRKCQLRGCLAECDSKPNMAGKILDAKGIMLKFGLKALDNFVYRREAYKDYFMAGGDALSHDPKANRDIKNIYEEIAGLYE